MKRTTQDGSTYVGYPEDLRDNRYDGEPFTRGETLTLSLPDGSTVEGSGEELRYFLAE